MRLEIEKLELRMCIGIILLGMAFGAASAGAWILTGGSILIGIALYSVSGTLFVLGTAVLFYLISERRETGLDEDLAEYTPTSRVIDQQPAT